MTKMPFEASRVLIVEDEGIVAEDLREILTDLGCQVIAVTSTGEEAVRKAELTEPDIIMMDIVLQGEMDGIEAARMIGSRSDVPVVFFTAHTDCKTLERVKEAGLFGYVVKP